MKGYRTIIVNVAAILAVAGAHYGFGVEPQVWEALLLPAVNIFLRWITTTPVGVQE